MIDIKEVLFEKYKLGELAHFYIVNGPTNISSSGEYLTNWIHDFITKVLLFEKKDISIENAENIIAGGHGDILEIKKENPADQYLKSDFDEFIRFQNYYNFELPHRFVIVHNASNVGELVSNKLLKSLEEPRPNTTIFFLNSENKSFLKTIESRAIQISLIENEAKLIQDDEVNSLVIKRDWMMEKVSNNTIYSDDFIQDLMNFYDKDEGSTKLLNHLKTNKEIQKEFFNLLINFERTIITDFKMKQTFLEDVIWFEKSKLFNGPAWERFISLLR